MPESVDLVLALSRRPLGGADPMRFLGGAAEEMARSLGVRGVVLVVPATGWVRGSDDTATLVGEIQHRDGQGPVAAAVRTVRPVLTPDLTWSGPPALAALAGEAGLTSSVAVAVTVEDRTVAVLQLLGGAERPVGQADLDGLGPATEVLGARIADLVEFARRRAPAPPQPAPPPETSPGDCTEALPTLDARHPARPARLPAPPPVRLDAVPAARPPRPVRIAVPAPAFDPVPLTSAPPELVTEELGTVAGAVARAPGRAVPRHDRHRHPGG